MDRTRAYLQGFPGGSVRQDRQRAASPMAHLNTTQHATRLIHDKTHTFPACTQQAPAQELLSPLELIPVSGPPPGNQTSGRRGARPPGGKDGTLLRRGYRVSPQLSLPGGAEMPWGSCVECGGCGPHSSPVAPPQRSVTLAPRPHRGPLWCVLSLRGDPSPAAGSASVRACWPHTTTSPHASPRGPAWARGSTCLTIRTPDSAPRPRRRWRLSACSSQALPAPALQPPWQSLC